MILNRRPAAPEPSHSIRHTDRVPLSTPRIATVGLLCTPSFFLNLVRLDRPNAGVWHSPDVNIDVNTDVSTLDLRFSCSAFFVPTSDLTKRHLPNIYAHCPTQYENAGQRRCRQVKWFPTTPVPFLHAVGRGFRLLTILSFRLTRLVTRPITLFPVNLSPERISVRERPDITTVP